MIEEIIKQYIPEKVSVEFIDNSAVFEVETSKIQKFIQNLNNNKSLSFKLMTATDERKENGCFKIWYIFSIPKENIFIIPFIKLINTEEFPSLALTIHKMWDYKRRINTFFGLKPIGHPDLRPIILHENWPIDIFPLRKDFDWKIRPQDAHGHYDFQKVEGEGIYEIPVGPIHAGIIEPGHFRFSVVGERIVLLEPRLGFTHKGSEKLFEILPLDDKVKLSEKISGDSSFSHSLAFCQALEKLGNIVVPKRALYLRTIFAELERISNHLGDIGAIMMDAGFNFGGAHGARLREMVMQINEKITGSRFLRGVNVVGGVTKNIEGQEKNILSVDLENIRNDFLELVKIAENSTTLLNRLEGTGLLSLDLADNRGVLGVVAKAVGVRKDTRSDYPYAAYEELFSGDIASEQGGDVYARFEIRIKEILSSIDIIKNGLSKLPIGSISVPIKNIRLAKSSLAVSMVEGWRGEIVYFLTTDSDGNIDRVAPRDPSFVNWGTLRYAGFDNVVPDFPLINKSFNLSYSGNDI